MLTSIIWLFGQTNGDHYYKIIRTVLKAQLLASLGSANYQLNLFGLTRECLADTPIASFACLGSLSSSPPHLIVISWDAEWVVPHSLLIACRYITVSSW